MTSTPDAAVSLTGVTKTFGKHVAVDDLVLSVPRGSVYGFIGPNGSGKTTTLRMIMNILYPDSGTIRVFGAPLSPAACDRIGYMPEERGLYRRMKVRELLVFLAGLKNGTDIRRSVDDWLARLDLSDWADKKVETLSKGMSQKVQFIATVVFQPDLVILDEPFAGLDPVNTEVMKDAILELRRRGTTVLFSTHDMSMAERMCDFVCMIFRGSKVLDGTLNDIRDTYALDTVRLRIAGDGAFLGSLHGVDHVNDYGRMQELRIDAAADPQEILRAVMLQTTVEQFEVVKPSLHDIFVRIAGPAAKKAVQEGAHA